MNLIFRENGVVGFCQTSRELEHSKFKANTFGPLCKARGPRDKVLRAPDKVRQIPLLGKSGSCIWPQSPGYVQGCVNIYNLYVSRYRCPQRVVLYPAPPNRIVLQVQNVDLGVTGNLGGQVVVLIPIALSGIVQLNIHQATITVQLAIERGPRGPYVRLLSCDMQIGYADAYIENGGLVGDVVNSQFRSQISNQVRQMIPGQVCGQLPNIINEKLNSKLGALPQTVALQQMISMFGGALGLNGGATGGSCPSTCPKQPIFLPSTNPQPATQVAPAPIPAAAPAPIVGGSAPAPQIPTSAYTEGASRRAAAVRTLQQLQALRHPRGANLTLVIPPGAGRQRVYAATIRAAGVGQYSAGAPVATYTNIGARPKYPPPPTIAVGPAIVQPPPDCSKCTQAGGSSEDPASFLRQVAAHLDLSKLNDLYLSIQYIQSYATSNDYTIDLTGEFSPYGQGGTPFGAFPTQFPYYGGQMAEFILTDYTVNSLFYWLHRNNSCPSVSAQRRRRLATEVELDEEEARRRRRLAKEKAKFRLRRGVHSNATIMVSVRPSRHVATHASPQIVAATNETTRLTTKKKRDSRRRRQEDTAGLADLGICFGDILPAVREKYPNQKIAVQIRTVRAPSVILSQARG
uniref:BPI1 domain-containing protein n=1 Tax=Caenorhabditis japonica TaxID=281687 RepID=A0A8R1EKN7_CAEJA